MKCPLFSSIEPVIPFFQLVSGFPSQITWLPVPWAHDPFFPTGQRFPIPNHVTSGSLSPRSLFPTGQHFPIPLPVMTSLDQSEASMGAIWARFTTMIINFVTQELTDLPLTGVKRCGRYRSDYKTQTMDCRLQNADSVYSADWGLQSGIKYRLRQATKRLERPQKCPFAGCTIPPPCAIGLDVNSSTFVSHQDVEKTPEFTHTYNTYSGTQPPSLADQAWQTHRHLHPFPLCIDAWNIELRHNKDRDFLMAGIINPDK